MTQTLTQIRASVLALLNDANQIYYTNQIIDAALRQTLEEYARLRCETAASVATSDGNKRQPLNVNAIAILAAEYPADARAQKIPIYATQQNDAWIIEFIDTIPPSGSPYAITYIIPQTINELDGATTTSINVPDMQAFILGAAGWAQLIRASGQIEAANINADTVKNLTESGLSKIALLRSTAKSASFIIAKWIWGK